MSLPFHAARLVLWVLLLASIGAAIVARWRPRDADLPWRPLDLAQPPGAFTVGKLAGLHRQPGTCTLLLRNAGVVVRPAPLRAAEPACAVPDGVRLSSGGGLTLRFAPASPLMACPLAAATTMWVSEVVQPAARRWLGSPVIAIEHDGTYNCRSINGMAGAGWSEHATADAIDVAGFRLADGRSIRITQGWSGSGRDAAFLHAVRDGACRAFATVLSPDYNRLHRDHLHLDEAARGIWGWHACS